MSRGSCAEVVPLVAIDRVLALEAGRITTLKAITANESYFPGHYPDHPVYPGVFIVEAVCQAVRRYAAHYNQTARLRRIVSTRFRLPLEPGDLFETECCCEREPDQATLSVKAICSNAAGKVAEVKAIFHVELKPC